MAVRPLSFRLLAGALVLLAIVMLDYGTRQIYLAFRRPAEKPRSPNGETALPERPTHRCPHPVYHHGLVANSSGIDVFGSTRTRYYVNSAGFRDGRIRAVHLDSKQPRVLLLGDSFAEGVGVPWEETLAGRLSASLAPLGVECLNGAVVSYSPTLLLEKLRYLYEKERLRTDLVVVFIDISDVQDELAYEARAGGGFDLKETTPWSDLRYPTWDHRLTDWLENRVEQNFTLLGAISRNLRQVWRSLGSPGGTPELKRGSWPEYRGPGEELIAEGLSRARQSMEGILTLTRQHRSKLMVVIYPWLEQVDAGIQPSRPEVFWGEWCRTREVPLANLFPLFVPMGRAYEKNYCLKGDGHWNAEGHRAVADFLRPRILELLDEKRMRPTDSR